MIDSAWILVSLGAKEVYYQIKNRFFPNKNDIDIIQRQKDFNISMVKSINQIQNDIDDLRRECDDKIFDYSQRETLRMAKKIKKKISML